MGENVGMMKWEAHNDTLGLGPVSKMEERVAVENI